MIEVGIDIEGDAVKRDPAPQPYTDGRDLVLDPRSAIGARNPHADTVLAAFSPDVEIGEGGDDPALKRADKRAHVLAAPLEVQHRIGDALAWPMIGELTAATSPMDRKPVRRDEVLRPGRGAGGIERRVLD